MNEHYKGQQTIKMVNLWFYQWQRVLLNSKTKNKI